MRSRWMFLMTILILASLLLAPAAPASAQDSTPPPPPSDTGHNPAIPDEGGDPELLALGLIQRGDFWAAEGGFTPQEEEIEAQATYSKADGFGYRSTKAAYSWVDAYNTGTKIATEYDWYEQVILPFPFRFYGYYTDQIYVSPYGFLTATWQNSLDAQSQLKQPYAPNNVIAPYWAPMEPAYSDSGMYVLSGGVAPNRWTAIEWHEFEDPDYDGIFTFEVVLYENGEILFQYELMDYDWYGWYCGVAGIEDRAGTTALTTLKYCYRQSSYQSIRIVPPASSARLSFTPASYGGLGSPGGVIEHRVSIDNIGDLGPDVFDLSLKGKWPGILYTEAGDLLVDTDGDGKIDTGPVDQGASVTIVAKITIPVKYKIGSRSDSTLTATSSINKKKSKTAKLENAVSANFVQAYGKNNEDIIQVSGPEGVEARTVSTESRNNPGIVETANGRLVYFWGEWICVGEECEIEHYQIYYSVYEHDGTPVLVSTPLEDLTGAASSVTMSYYAAAAGPFGSVGFTYTRRVNDVYNVYFTAIDENGMVTVPAMNITNNTLPATDPLGPRFYDPELAVTADEHFILGWEQYLYTNSISYYDVFDTVIDVDGSVLQPPAKLTSDPGYTANYYAAHVSKLAGNKTLIGWTYWLRTGTRSYKYTYYVQYMILDSFGNVVYKPSGMKVGTFANGLDSAQMTNGDIVLAWTGGSYPRYYINYAVLSGKTFKKTKGTTSLKHSTSLSDADYVSVTTDNAGQAILTWKDYSDQNLKYALLGKNGAIKTKPMIYQSIHPYNGWSNISYNGNGNTTYGVPRPVTVTLTATVPSTTDATGKMVYLAGNFNGWDPVAMPMTRVDKTHWRITLVINEKYPMIYKYTLGDWEHVEKGKKCVEINDRVLDVQYGTAGTMKKSDTVSAWRNVLPCTGD